MSCWSPCTGRIASRSQRSRRCWVAAYSISCGISLQTEQWGYARTMGMRPDGQRHWPWSEIALSSSSTEPSLPVRSRSACSLNCQHLVSSSSCRKRCSMSCESCRLRPEVARTPRGTIGLHRGKLFFLESSPEEIAQEVARIESVIQFIHSHCEVVGGEATLDLPNELRARLEELLDHTSTDAVALAIKRGAPCGRTISGCNAS